MRTRFWRVIGASMLSIISACSSEAPPASPVARNDTSPTCSVELHHHGLLLVTGADPYNAVLRLRPACGLVEEQASKEIRFSAISWSPARTVATVANFGPDQVQLLEAGRLVSIPGVGRPAGVVAVVNLAGHLSWVAIGKSQEPDFVVRLWNGSKESNLIGSNREIGWVSPFGAFNTFAVAIAAGKHTHLVRIHEGSRPENSEVRLPLDDLTAFTGSERHNIIGLANATTSGMFEITATGAKELLSLGPGNRPLAWTEDGRFCLIANGKKLMAFDAHSRRLLPLPEAQDPVYAAAWK